MVTLIQTASVVCGGVLTITNFLLLWLRPLREKITGERLIKDGEKCLLRSDMLEIYYKNISDKRIRQYERENFDLLYKSYKSLGGNSFIDDVYAEVREWTVVS